MDPGGFYSDPDPTFEQKPDPHPTIEKNPDPDPTYVLPNEIHLHYFLILVRFYTLMFSPDQDPTISNKTGSGSNLIPNLDPEFSFYLVQNLDDGTFVVKFDRFFCKNRGNLLLGLETIVFMFFPI